MPWCSHCAKNQPTENENLNGFLCCTGCGKVLEEEIYSTEVTFIKTSGGQSQLSGTYIRNAQDDSSESRERTLRKGRDEIHDIVVSLCVSGGESTIDYAHNLYRIAVERNFTRGRSTKQVAAVCVYIVCRQEDKPYLLIDFSDFLQLNVYVLGAVFLRLCKLLRLEEHPIVQKPIDPSLFIHRFSIRLLGKDDKESRQVGFTAMRIIASMKRDWIQTGRKPSGLCGAALYISALSYGLKCSKSDVVTVVHICEATLTKRLIEFENTESGSLTIEEFMTKAEELEAEARQLPLVSKMTERSEVLCEHKGQAPHFAHGLCKECYRDFLRISGGIQGGSEPPAFQRAERQRMAKSSLDQKAEMPASNSMYCEGETIHSHAAMTMEYSSKQLPKSIDDGPIPSSDSETICSLSGSEASQGKSHEKGSNYECLNTPSIEKVQLHEYQNMGCNDESETLSDIDDAEVDGYLHDEEETRLKTIIWTEMNKEYLEEQAAKEAAAAAARATYISSLENSGDMPAAFELAAAAAAAVEKLKKDRRQKRAEEAKNATPAQTPGQAARQMLTKKRLSSRINYDVLEKLFDDNEAPETKKPHIEPVGGDDSILQWQSKKEEEDKGFESKAVDDDYQVYGDAYGAEDAGKVFGNHSYYGDEEDYYGYDDGYGSEY